VCACLYHGKNLNGGLILFNSVKVTRISSLIKNGVPIMEVFILKKKVKGKAVKMLRTVAVFNVFRKIDIRY
jgi:hypothetical protein